MGVILQPMTKQDYYNLVGEVKTSATKDGYDSLADGLDSKRVFGSFATKGYTDLSLERDNTRARIKLSKPVFNYVLSRSGAVLLQKILGLSEKEMLKATEYTHSWSEDLQDVVDISNLEAHEPLVCGAELAKKWIDDFDIFEGIKNEFWNIICECCGKNEVDGIPTSLEDYGTLNKNRVGIKLCGGYYLDPAFDPESKHPLIKKNHVLSEVSAYMHEVYLTSADTRLSYLLNLPNKDRIYGMIQEYVAVLPPGMRPAIQNRPDAFTKLYVKVIKANQELDLAKSGSLTHEEMRLKYLALDTAISKLQYKTDKNDKNVKSVLEKVKGKKGRVRNNLLGKRQDYSGRSAVIVDPFMSMRNIGIPEAMLPKLFRYHLLKHAENKNVYNLISAASDEDCIKLILEKNILQEVPVMLGRQPTLHKLSIQGFKAVPTKAKAIKVPPLVCPAFNMDFDGDTGHVQVPLSKAAIRELNDLIMSTQNLYLPKTGECTICPRQDILYGLFMCTRDTYMLGNPKASYSNYYAVRDLVLKHKLKVYDTVEVNGEIALAGRIAFKSCFPANVFVGPGMPEMNGKVDVVQINDKTIKKYVNIMLKRNIDIFISAIDSMVELGFKIAKIYAPSMSLLSPTYSNTEAAKKYDTAMPNFHKEMEEANELYDLGLEDETSYSLRFDDCFKKVEDDMKAGIKDKLGPNNGYVLLAESGARGNASNLVQMFAYKGRIVKSSTETFAAVIEHSYADQLTPLEHFITAYGGRKGQMDKSLKTGETGYAMRQMWHGAGAFVIKSLDCGTKEGITIKKSDIALHADDAKEVDSIFRKIITGRFRAESNTYITEELAEQYSNEYESIVIRSPLTCKDPCCVKCYGDDPSINDDAAVGLPIGFIAAHSIGEPGTQLVMKQFQKGGVAGRGDVTSNFTRMENYIHCADLGAKSAKGKYPTYDPIAWEDGPVVEVTKDELHKRVTIGGNKRKGVVLPREAVLKTYAKKGEGLCIKRGDYSIKEVEKYCGINEAQLYLVYALYNIYKSECDIISKHFEVLVASMTQHMIIDTDRKDLRIGQYCTTSELLRGSLDNTDYVTGLQNIKKLPLISLSSISNVMFENIGFGLSRAVLLGLEDGLEDPLQRMIFGLPAKAGTYYDDFIMNRKRR